MMKCEVCGGKVEFSGKKEFSAYNKKIIFFECCSEHLTPMNLWEVAEKYVADFLIAEVGERLVIDSNGNVYFQESSTFSSNEIASVSCTGIGNHDFSFFTEDFVDWDDDLRAYVTLPEHEENRR